MTRRCVCSALTCIMLSSFAASSFGQQLPRPAPEFTAMTSAGKPLQLSHFRGKALVVQFFLTECPHCQEAARVIERLQRKYRARGLQAIAVAFNQDARSKLPGFVRNTNLTFPVAFASQLAVFQYLQLSVTKQYSVPFLAFVDRSGVLRAQFTGGDDFFRDTDVNMQSNIESLLKYGVPSARSAGLREERLQRK